MSLIPRHGNTHFANLKYGYLALAVSAGFVLILLVARHLAPSRDKTRSRFRNWVARDAYHISPLLYLPVLFIALFIPFVHHYSLKEHLSLYIKRLGRLSYVLVTLNLFITIRPNVMLPGVNYLDLIPLHKWLSRCLALLAIGHGTGFLALWAVQPNTSVSEKVFGNVWNLIGVVIFGLLVLLLLLTLRPVRRKNYRLFYGFHIIMSWCFVLATALHARPGVFAPYTIVNACIFLVQIVSKIAFVKNVDVLAKHDENSYSTLRRITFPRYAMGEDFTPARHVRVSCYRTFHPLYWILPSRPFTVASLPSDDHVELIMREHPDGFKFQTGVNYTIQNSFPSLPTKALASATRVALVCGGSGISYALPLFRYFAVENCGFLKLIWLVRDKEDISVLKDVLFPPMKSDQFEIFVTKSTPPDDQVGGGSAMVNRGDRDLDDIEFELESLSEPLNLDGGLLKENGKQHGFGIAANVHLGRRLEWAADLANFVELDALDTTWLMVCGPQGLIDAGQDFTRQNKINLASEVYAL
ncbi:LAMI_0H10352g1_1 [Lachancea mirantina]|uniref:Probable metalloreductase AIM14 n=1 Tax=Lachancea mirantina TaxID=1230905 RepID=A0A1G4KGT5_9SACH|nr:LAMI_0H10352g1_1 [Lachancea mirantina]